MLLLIFCHHCATFSSQLRTIFYFLVLYLIWRLCLIFPSQVATGTGPPAPNVRFYDVLMCAKEPLAFLKMNRKPLLFLFAHTPARAPVHGGVHGPHAQKIEGQEENYDLISQSSHTDFSILKIKKNISKHAQQFTSKIQHK